MEDVSGEGMGENKTETETETKTRGKEKDSTHTCTGAGEEPQLASLMGAGEKDWDCASFRTLPLLLVVSMVEGRWKLPLLLSLLLADSCRRHVSSARYSGDDSLQVAPTDGEALADMEDKEESKDVLKEGDVPIMSMSMSSRDR